MFTGIINGQGKLLAVESRGHETRFRIQALYDLADIILGESIAVNGTCLTVETSGPSLFSAYASAETMQRTALGLLKPGAKVNLERAMQVGGRLGGHIVSGHIDGVGHVARIATDGIARVITISIPKDMEPFIVEKGSITIDGISLTVVSVGNSQFSVSIIPHTMANTTLMDKHPGAIVNLETDVIGKYVHSFTIGHPSSASSGLTMEKLLENGF